MTETDSMVERFWAKVCKTDNCWTWSGTRDARGYGSLRVGKRMRKATHVSVFIHTGEWPTTGKNASEMVERVAKAMCAADGYLPDAESNDGEGQMLWTTYVEMARAAIEAMKTPTDLMGNGLPSDYRPGSHSATQIWQAMIVKALEE